MGLVRVEPDQGVTREENTELLLAIRTKVRGAQTDLTFDDWLIEQVADLLESRSQECG